MDIDLVRTHAEAHGRAIVAGDMPAVMDDMAEQMHAALPQIAATLPQPTRKAEVLSVEPDGERAVVHIRYSGDDTQTTVRSVWEGERPRISAAEPVRD